MKNAILFLKYYYDVNKVNIIISIVILIWQQHFWAAVVSFATLGLLASYLSFNYFRKIEYYFYANVGYSKRQLIAKTWAGNILLSSTLYFLFR
ncbi:MAG: hypothetical protein ACTHLE_21260 [Agriterribacter sp.]